MKKLYIIIIILLAFVALFIYFSRGKEKPNHTLGQELYLIDYNNGNGALVFNFLSDKDLRQALSLAIDSNNDQNFTDDEWVLQDIMVLPKEGASHKVYFSAPEDFSDDQYVLVKLGDEQVIKYTSIESQDISELMDLESVTNPEEAMKGLFNRALAEDTIEITQDGVPDISQKPGECAPTSAANGLTSLINRNGQTPQAPQEMIEELKQDMKWTRENGVEPDDFVAGKNAWAKRHNLPIVTTKVGDTHGINTINEIKEALDQGGAVELRIKFGDASGKAAGGHMVTVTGLHQGEGQTYLDINDPYTPEQEGSETVEVRSNQITNYGPWQHITVLSWGFTQVWQKTETEETSGVMMEDNTTNVSVGTDLPTFNVTMETSFQHVKPGEYSEVYAAVSAKPGDEVCLTLSGPGVDDQKQKTVVADSNGQAYFKWKIVSYGTYDVSGDCGDTKLSGTVVVN